MEHWLKTQTCSGPHDIDDEKRALNIELQKKVSHLLPFDDPHKVNDVDLLYRFLIARKWNVDAAAEMIEGYVKWRKDNNVNGITTESFPEEIQEHYISGFQGVDVHGNPVYYECPDPKGIVYLLQQYDRGVLLRWHMLTMELGRRRAKALGKDRSTVVLDLRHIGMGIVTNTTAVGFLKEIAHMDQAVYPECMRYMVILNAPWAFSTVWSIIRPLLDERVQKKINVVKGDVAANIVKFIDVCEVPDQFGGTGGEFRTVVHELSNVREGAELLQTRSQSFVATREAHPDEDDAAGHDEFQSVCSNDEQIEQRLREIEEDDVLDPNESIARDSNAIRQAGGFGSDVSDDDDEDDARGVESPSFQLAPFRSFEGSTLTLRNAHNHQGYPTTQCIVAGKPVFETTMSLIVACPKPGSTSLDLVAELVSEPGHPVHVYFLVVDRDHHVRYILKRRRLHKEIEVFEPNPATPTLLSKKLTFKGKSTQTLSVKPTPTAPGREFVDWQAKLLNVSPKPVALRRQRDKVEWNMSVASSLRTAPPEVIFALVIAIQQLWLV